MERTTSKPSSSVPATAQTVLPGMEELAVFFDMDRQDVHTGARTLRDRERALEIVRHALQFTWRSAATAFKVSDKTVTALVRHFAVSGELTTLKQELTGRLQAHALALMDSMDEDLGKLKGHERSIRLGIVLDKLASLAPEAAPSAPPQMHVHASLDEWKREMARVRSSRVIDVTSSDKDRND